MARLDAGHTVALDDPIAAARFLAEEVEFWRDAGIYYFVPCVFEGRDDRGARARPQGNRRAVQQRGPRPADRGRRAGGDRDRERPPVPPAAPEGRRARPHARVQREHPRVARRRAGGVRRGRADRPLEPRARGLLRRHARRPRSAACSPTSSTRRSSRRCGPRARSIPTARRCTACRWPRATRTPRGCSSTPPRCRCRTRRATTPWSARCC